MKNESVKIIERSLLARIARIVRKSDTIAMVIGERIYLSGVSKREFLEDPTWLKHEMIHVEQYRKYGMIKFLFLYLMEWFKKGYKENRFEVEARKGSEKL
jgi:hypothetical protein